MVSVNPDIHDAILQRASAQEMSELASRQGARTLREDGIRKVLAGLTTPDEVIRATVGDVE